MEGETSGKLLFDLDFKRNVQTQADKTSFKTKMFDPSLARYNVSLRLRQTFIFSRYARPYRVLKYFLVYGSKMYL